MGKMSSITVPFSLALVRKVNSVFLMLSDGIREANSVKRFVSEFKRGEYHTIENKIGSMR